MLAMSSKAAYDSCDKADGIDLGSSPVNYKILVEPVGEELFFICGIGANESSSAFPVRTARTD